MGECVCVVGGGYYEATNSDCHSLVEKDVPCRPVTHLHARFHHVIGLGGHARLVSGKLLFILGLNHIDKVRKDLRGELWGRIQSVDKTLADAK